jgi:hypothetical protein
MRDLEAPLFVLSVPAAELATIADKRSVVPP